MDDDSVSDDFEPTLFAEDYMGGATKISRTKVEPVDDDTVAIDDTAADESSDSEEPYNDEISSQNIERIVIADNNKMTSDLMNLFEMTEYVSIRATQIAKHNNCMVDITGLSDPILMAKRELMARKSPLMLERERSTINSAGVHEVYVEYWNPNEMIFSQHYDEATII